MKMKKKRMMVDDSLLTAMALGRNGRDQDFGLVEHPQKTATDNRFSRVVMNTVITNPLEPREGIIGGQFVVASRPLSTGRNSEDGRDECCTTTATTLSRVESSTTCSSSS